MMMFQMMRPTLSSRANVNDGEQGVIRVVPVLMQTELGQVAKAAFQAAH